MGCTMPRTVVPMKSEMRMESRPAGVIHGRGIHPLERSIGAGKDACGSPSSKNSSRFAGKRIHFIGIGGCGMSGLAQVLLDAGAIVSGSDANCGPVTDALRRAGAVISNRQDGSLIHRDLDLVVRTAAIPENNAEYHRALIDCLPQLKYAQLLGLVMQERLGIAVSGTHGKTTTTSMISYGLLECGADPSFVIGGTVHQLGGSSRSGQGQAFVVEACEFDRSFHSLHPKVAVLTNIEADHLDCYPQGIDEIVESFRTFARLVPPGGRIIANGHDIQVRRALSDLPASIEWVGLDDSDLTWSTIPLGVEDGCHTGQVLYKGTPVARLRLSVPGTHNLFNATAAIAACHAAGVAPADAAKAISRFAGADRRMTLLGQLNGALVVDDYGHHPTEIRTTLRALRERYTPRRLVCVFQPHQHSRTRHLLDDFATCFADADLAIITDIYSARDTEADRQSVSTADLVQRVRSTGRHVKHVPTLCAVVECLGLDAHSGDLIVTMGAGNVGDVGPALLASVKTA